MSLWAVAAVATALFVQGVGTGGTTAESAHRAWSPAVAQDETNEAWALLVETNKVRAAHGVAPLRAQNQLWDAAMWFAQDMAEHDYLSHTDRLGRNVATRLAHFGYGGAFGENVARGYPTVAEVVEAWMGSDGHRANLLQPGFREAGMGYFKNPDNAYVDYWVQDFGTRPGVYPVIINGEEPATLTEDVLLYVHGTGWAEDMRISNDGNTWTGWQSFTPELEWTLASGSGLKTVTVEIRRGADVRQAYDTIQLDGGSGLPSPTPSPTPTQGEEPPTATPTVSSNQTDTPEPPASETPNPTPTSEPSDTPEVTETPDGSATPEVTVAPSETPEETPGVPPTQTPSATATEDLPTPTDTPTNTATAISTAEDPSPTATESPPPTGSPTAGRVFLPWARSR